MRVTAREAAAHVWLERKRATEMEIGIQQKHKTRVTPLRSDRKAHSNFEISKPTELPAKSMKSLRDLIPDEISIIFSISLSNLFTKDFFRIFRMLR